MKTLATWIVVLSLGWAPGCRSDPGAAGGGGRDGPQVGEVSDLPAPSRRGERSLEEALARRRSVRRYTGAPLRVEEISQLFWAAQGVTESSGKRTAPSAGALYPLELYVVTPRGVDRYLPGRHRLERLRDGDLRGDLAAAALGQEEVAEAAAVFVIAGVHARTETKYRDRAGRYVLLEAGHACQNLLLQATVLGLGAVPIGAFHDDQVQSTLGLPPDHEPLYVVPVGRPAAGS